MSLGSLFLSHAAKTAEQVYIAFCWQCGGIKEHKCSVVNQARALVCEACGNCQEIGGSIPLTK